MTEWKTATLVPRKQIATIKVQNGNNETIGTLDFNGPEMVFTGNADESAKVFIDFVAERFSDRLKQEREAEREACAKVCEELRDNLKHSAKEWAHADLWDMAEGCAAAIRARSKT